MSHGCLHLMQFVVRILQDISVLNAREELQGITAGTFLPSIVLYIYFNVHRNRD